jgi:nicotinate-nucleotide adenylyltransferase
MPPRRDGYGIFGGLFDPPHAGHLIIAQFVRQEFGLKKIIFVPAGNPPHKTAYSAFLHRRRMTELAVRDNRDFQVDPVEGRLPGKTYTVDVIKFLKKSYPYPLYMIIGADQWAEIGTWKDPASLFRLCRLIVVPRSKYPVPPRSSRVMLSCAPRIDISSTMVRKLVAGGLSIKYLTPDPVIAYIKDHRLKKIWK